jgi:hypothetical protein
VGNTALALQVLITLLQQSQTLSNLVAKAQAEGRDLTDAEVDSVVAADDAAKAELAAAIVKARGG